MEKWIFKILRPHEWRAACTNPKFDGAPVDLADGFIHFSTCKQLQETANKHFADSNHIYVLAFNAESWSAKDLRWEPSRGGALFPHVYAPLNIQLSEEQWELSKEPGNDFNLSPIYEWIARHD